MAEPEKMGEYSIQYTPVLVCHPDTSSQDVQVITVCVGLRQDDVLTLTYTLTGDCTRLRIPLPRPSAKTDGLWQHTCFEAFLSIKDELAYRELNFSPSGEWAVYHFHGYRDRSPLGEEDPAPKINVRCMENGLILDANIRLPHQLTLQPLRLGLSAVIEDDWGKLSYWALKHPPGKPDFHHPDAFALEIAPMSREALRRKR